MPHSRGRHWVSGGPSSDVAVMAQVLTGASGVGPVTVVRTVCDP